MFESQIHDLDGAVAILEHCEMGEIAPSLERILKITKEMHVQLEQRGPVEATALGLAVRLTLIEDRVRTQVRQACIEPNLFLDELFRCIDERVLFIAGLSESSIDDKDEDEDEELIPLPRISLRRTTPQQADGVST